MPAPLSSDVVRQFGLRMMLHVAGFYWICHKRPATPQPRAPIYVVNHIGIFDAVYFLVWDFPMIVAKARLCALLA